MSEHGFIRRKGLDRLQKPVAAPNSFTGVRRDPYFDPQTAPYDVPLTVEVSDGSTAYALPFQCKRTPQGWVHAERGTAPAVEIIGWRRSRLGLDMRRVRRG